MSTVLKAKETSYKNYRMRSRLEARWCIFLDACGVPWDYEKQGYDLPSGSYLPDIHVPVPGLRNGKWIEVKGTEPTESEKQLCRELALATEATVLLVWGDPGSFSFWNFSPIDREPMFVTADASWRSIWPEMHDFWYRVTLAELFLNSHLGMWTPDKMDMNLQLKTVAYAIKAARSARFEHGETPNT